MVAEREKEEREREKTTKKKRKRKKVLPASQKANFQLPFARMPSPLEQHKQAPQLLNAGWLGRETIARRRPPLLALVMPIGVVQLCLDEHKSRLAKDGPPTS